MLDFFVFQSGLRFCALGVWHPYNDVEFGCALGSAGPFLPDRCKHFAWLTVPVRLRSGLEFRVAGGGCKLLGVEGIRLNIEA